MRSLCDINMPYLAGNLDVLAGWPTDEEVRRAIESVPRHFAAVQFSVPFETVATSSTPKSVAGIKCPANQAVKLIGVDIGFDGTNSTQGPVLCELMFSTFATNSPGTNSTTITPTTSDSGRPETVQSTAAKTWSTEPTVLTLWRAFFIPVYMGSGIISLPLTAPMICKGGNGMVLRITQQSGVTANATGTLFAEE